MCGCVCVSVLLVFIRSAAFPLSALIFAVGRLVDTGGIEREGEREIERE